MIKADLLSRRPDLLEGIENNNKAIQLLPTFQESWKMAGTILETQGDVFIEEIKNGVLDYGWKAIQMLKESMKGTKKASNRAMWLKEEGIITRDGSIVVPKDQELKRKIISVNHNSITTGHPDSSRLPSWSKETTTGKAWPMTSKHMWTPAQPAQKSNQVNNNR